ncbi:Sec-independent protein translocase protein TatB [Tepidicella xavieri]|jgi:sec-independent protein translocase protein TatB|uniref:Sec-independent protein translocase protein TatB n=1 Tax=Tepidicella xavieri TaxID=360241 RepID=A0A4V3D6B9_9BURK|nr:Sec-independent protein translocase protein TatB [Tepidicella xavieri]TDQ43337.1 sec-independent protein translocase protein TatB [Tepidicella xavieri]
MIDLGISKLALIGVVALVVIGPEKLPRVARTVGTLLGKAQRYVAEVKAEVNRTMELEELKKMKESVESAARDVESSIHQTANDFEKEWSEVTAGLENASSTTFNPSDAYSIGSPVYPEYKHPKKNFRLKQKAVPQWFKARTGIRTRALSGAARVARFRPKSRSF